MLAACSQDILAFEMGRRQGKSFVLLKSFSLSPANAETHAHRFDEQLTSNQVLCIATSPLF